MPYAIFIDPTDPWLVIEYSGIIEGGQLVASRAEAATLNAEATVRDFILDFTDVTEFVLSAESVNEIHVIDRERRAMVSRGRCALVAPRDLVEIGTTFLAAVSPLNLDYRTFANRERAEAWLRGDVSGVPPSLPRRR